MPNKIAKRKQELFHEFGRLDTWIVGLQYYAGATAAEKAAVIFERDPENPFDSNAVAVFTTKGVKLGNLPRYDAVYFSPLILQGLVALKGETGESQDGDRIPLALTIYATSKVSAILEFDAVDNWKSLYHNIFVNVWAGLPGYSTSTLEEFRNRFRPLAHEEPLYPKTQFLYRMLKAKIVEMKYLENQRLRDKVVASFNALQFGQFMGWPELSAIPLYPEKNMIKKKQPRAKSSKVTALEKINDNDYDIAKLLPLRCPCPKEACGIVVLTYGKLYSIAWYSSPEITQVYWYNRIMDGFSMGMINTNDNDDEKANTPKAIKSRIAQQLKCAEYRIYEDDEGNPKIESEIIINLQSYHNGSAKYHNNDLTNLDISAPDMYID